ncbi:ribosome maturation factor RimP [Desulfovibrionales bacterium]
MDKAEIHARLLEIITPMCRARSIDVWGVELLFEAGGRYKIVRIYLDSPTGISIDECTEVSRHLSLTLDVEDIIPGAYTLEVSSPGLERPFFSLDQMQPFLGQTVHIRLNAGIEGRKNFKGCLLAITPPTLTLRVDTAEYILDWQDVAKAHLIYDHPDQGRPGRR